MAVIMDMGMTTDNYMVYNQPTSSSLSVIQRVPFICSLKCERKESGQLKAVAPLSNVSATDSDIFTNISKTFASTSETTVIFSDGVGYVGDGVKPNILEDFPYHVLGVHFPNITNEADCFTLQFNLEFLESNFMPSVRESEEIVTATNPSVFYTEEDLNIQTEIF